MLSKHTGFVFTVKVGWGGQPSRSWLSVEPGDAGGWPQIMPYGIANLSQI